MNGIDLLIMLSSEFRIVLILIPSRGIIDNVFPYLVQVISIANDVFIIISLP